MARRRYSSGITLIELMIVVAIIAVLAGIAIPAYNAYVTEAQFGAARLNVEPLRLALEDYWLDNQTYADIDGKKWQPSGTQDLKTTLGWRPDGDEDAFNYSVTAPNADSYSIEVTHIASNKRICCTKQADCKSSDEAGYSCP